MFWLSAAPRVCAGVCDSGLTCAGDPHVQEIGLQLVSHLADEKFPGKISSVYGVTQGLGACGVGQHSRE